MIVNADASQLYADLPVLSAQPGADDRAAVPHRLYGVLHGAEAGSAASWAMLARAEIDAAHAAGRLALLVGGNGMYLRALLDGIAAVPAIDAVVRAGVRDLDPAAARTALQAEDPAAAARLHPADRQRTLRALEVVRSSGRPLAAWQAAATAGLAATHRIAAIVVTRDRTDLHARVAARIAAMLDAGALAEVATLLARRLPPDRPVLRTIGVAALGDHLAGDTTLDEARQRLLTETRQYAKRQATWWRNQLPDWRRVDASSHPNIQGLSEFFIGG